MMTVKPDYAQMAVNGAIQGTLIVGQIYLAKELSIAQKDGAGRIGITVLSTVTSVFVMSWLKRQSFYPDV